MCRVTVTLKTITTTIITADIKPKTCVRMRETAMRDRKREYEHVYSIYNGCRYLLFGPFKSSASLVAWAWGGEGDKEKEQREITLETSITLHAVVWRIVSSFINYNDYSLTFFVLRTIWETYINFELSHAAKSHAWEGYSIRDMQKKIYALHNGLFGLPLRFSWRWYTLNSDYHLIEFFKSGLLNRVCWIKGKGETFALNTLIWAFISQHTEANYGQDWNIYMWWNDCKDWVGLDCLLPSLAASARNNLYVIKSYVAFYSGSSGSLK